MGHGRTLANTSGKRRCLILAAVVLVVLAGCSPGDAEQPFTGETPIDGAVDGPDGAPEGGTPGASGSPGDADAAEPDATADSGTSIDWPGRLGAFTLLRNDDLRVRFESGAVERHWEPTFFEQHDRGWSHFFGGRVEDLRGAEPGDYYAYADAAEPGPDYPNEVLTRYYALDPDGYRQGEEHALILRLERAEYRDGAEIHGRETILRGPNLLWTEHVGCYPQVLVCFAPLEGPHFWTLSVPAHTFEMTDDPADWQYLEEYRSYLGVADDAVEEFVHLTRE